MSDFGSLLSQLDNSAKQLPANNRATEDNAADNTRPRKRPRQEQQQVDAASFPPIQQVYCLCPAGVQTGGPEALHQLCDEINGCATFHVRASMLYVKTSGDGRIVPATRAQTPVAYIDLYDAPVATADKNPLVKSGSFLDSTTTLLVWPECFTNEMLQYLDDNNNSNPCQCAIWWLSVNNNTGRFQEWNRNDIIHLYQSEYAKQYISSKGARHIYRMTEYISLTPASSEEERSIDVLYNPLKGIHYTDAIKKRSGSIVNIRPIGSQDGREQRVSPEQVRELLSSAKIYCDFGPHPGMDRLPREAALAGCCVVTNKEGAANYDEDVPLPVRYKVQEFNADAIHKLLVDLLDNFDERTKDFNEYRTWINGQKERMKECVSSFLDQVVEKRTQQNS